VKISCVTNIETNSEVLENKKKQPAVQQSLVAQSKRDRGRTPRPTTKAKAKGDAGDGLMPRRYGNKQEGLAASKKKKKGRAAQNMEQGEKSCASTDWGR
jgi:hypothetical protein